MTEGIGYTGSSYEKIIHLVIKEKWVINLSSFMMACMQIVFCIGGVLFSVKLLNHSMCIGKVDALCNHDKLITLISFVIAAPTFFVKDLTFFSNLTFISTGVVLCLVSCITWKAGKFLTVRGQAVQSQIEWSKIPSAFSVVSYALEGIGMVIPVKNSMRDQSKFWNLTVVSVLLVSVLYLVPTLIMSAAFGIGTKQIVLDNFIEESPLVHALALVYIGCIFMTYPLNLFPVYTVMLNTKWSRDYIGKYDEASNPQRKDKIKNVLLISRIFCMAVIFIITISGPNLVPFLSLAGAIFIGAFGYFFPVLIYNTHFGRLGQLSPSRKAMNYLFLVVMGGISVFTVVDGARNLFTEKGGSLH